MATPTVQFNVRFEPDELAKLTDLAKRSGLGRAKVIRRLIQEACDQPQRVQFLKGASGDD